jgi:hypothetical protein
MWLHASNGVASSGDGCGAAKSPRARKPSMPGMLMSDRITISCGRMPSASFAKASSPEARCACGASALTQCRRLRSRRHCHCRRGRRSRCCPFRTCRAIPSRNISPTAWSRRVTALSRIRWLFVIARNSTFTYKGKAVDVKRVGRHWRPSALPFRHRDRQRNRIAVSPHGSAPCCSISTSVLPIRAISSALA